MLIFSYDFFSNFLKHIVGECGELSIKFWSLLLSMMQVLGLKAKSRIALLIVLVLCVGFAGLYGLLKPVSNGCNMTYMYPTYIPIPITSSGASLAKYGLFLYHEGWKTIDFKEHIQKLSGIPVLFIPGNGGSYKQVRSWWILLW